MHIRQPRLSGWNSGIFVAVTIVILLAPLAVAQKPDVAGTWKLNEAKSDRATGAPSDMIIRVRVEGPEAWFITTTRGETIKMQYNTEGQERVNHTPDATITSTVQWEGNTLVGVHRLKARDWQLTQRERITWSRDGRTMTVVRIGAGPNQRDQKLVYDRQ
jgi:hypothetical protein